MNFQRFRGFDRLNHRKVYKFGGAETICHVSEVARCARATKLHLDLVAELVAARSKPLQVPPTKQQFFEEKLLGSGKTDFKDFKSTFPLQFVLSPEDNADSSEGDDDCGKNR